MAPITPQGRAPGVTQSWDTLLVAGPSCPQRLPVCIVSMATRSAWARPRVCGQRWLLLLGLIWIMLAIFSSSEEHLLT